METIKRKLFSELLKIGLPMGSFTLTILEETNTIMVKAFNLSIYQGKLPETFEGVNVSYESRI